MISLILGVVLMLGAFSCAKKQEPKPAAAAETNPFFMEWTAPFGTPPFPEIKEAHYMPAFEDGMARQKKEVEAIASTSRARRPSPTRSRPSSGAGELLTKVNNVFST